MEGKGIAESVFVDPNLLEAGIYKAPPRPLRTVISERFGCNEGVPNEASGAHASHGYGDREAPLSGWKFLLSSSDAASAEATARL